MLTFFALLLAATAPFQSAPGQRLIPAAPYERAAECKGKTFASAEEALQSGCCSWHNGVCGCSNGRKTCCDGTVSPSCKC
jgi:hypothetical protein